MQNNSNMIVHVLLNIAQEARCNDTDDSKCCIHVSNLYTTNPKILDTYQCSHSTRICKTPHMLRDQ